MSLITSLGSPCCSAARACEPFSAILTRNCCPSSVTRSSSACDGLSSTIRISIGSVSIMLDRVLSVRSSLLRRRSGGGKNQRFVGDNFPDRLSQYLLGYG